MSDKTKWTISLTPVEDMLLSSIAEMEDTSKSEVVRKALRELVDDKHLLELMESLLPQFYDKMVNTNVQEKTIEENPNEEILREKENISE